MSTLTDLAGHLEALGHGVRGDDSGNSVGIFLGSRPDAPDEVLVIYSYPGGVPEYVQNRFGPRAENPQIQIVTRAREYDRAEAIAYGAWYALAAVTNQDFGGIRYRSIKPNHSPAGMGRDTNDRPLVVFNCTVEKEVPVGI